MATKPPFPLLTPEAAHTRMVESANEETRGKTVRALGYADSAACWVLTFTDESEIWLPGPLPPTPVLKPPRALKPPPRRPMALAHALPYPCAVCGLLCRDARTTEQVPPADRFGPLGYTVQHRRCPRRFWRPLVRLAERLWF